MPIFSAELPQRPLHTAVQRLGLVPLFGLDEFPDLEVVRRIGLHARLDEAVTAMLGAAHRVDGVVDDVEPVDELGHVLVDLPIVGAPLDCHDVLEVGHFQEGVGLYATALSQCVW